MRQYGLIGKRLGHSFSQRYFEEKFATLGRFDCRYNLFELPSLDGFREFVDAVPDLMGLNVTIPYKQAVMPLLDELDPEAEAVGAVNTVRVWREDGKLRLAGYNTDVEGFRRSLAGHPLPRRALVLINCTPVGMCPDENTCPPLPYEALSEHNFLYDLVYNPEETLFLKRGRERGALTQNGLTMLHLQADAAWEIWNLSRR